ncbi:MAG: dUTP diphosphatase [Kiritimatiellae bacterium]|nr:dUTP diphosphatase [Kiritimatiellia bacterium]
MTVRFRKIHPAAALPAYAHDGDAGMDLRSVEDIAVAPGARALVRTGLVMMLPPGYEGQVRPRSGLALRHGVTVLNSPGTVDAGYRGEVGVILANFGDAEFSVRRGDRIAQLVIAPVLRAGIEEVEAVDDTDRGEGGFGSTGRS